jgi:hypothetical protein
MTGKFNKLRALPAPERRLLAAAAMALPLFWLGLRLAGFARFQAWLDAHSAAARGKPPHDPASVARLVDLAARNSPCPANCLTRSLLLRWMLHRRGIDCHLRIGVRLTGASLAAHAWVEHDQLPLNDTNDVARRYSVFDGAISMRAFPAFGRAIPSPAQE